MSPLVPPFSTNHMDEALRWLLTLPTFRSLRWLGLVSYSVYLWQQPSCLAHWLFGFARMRVIGLTVPILVGCASFYLLENPIRRWLNANWRRGKAAAQLPSPQP